MRPSRLHSAAVAATCVLTALAGCTPALKYEPNLSVADTPVVEQTVFFSGFADQAPGPALSFIPKVELRFNLVRKGDGDRRVPRYEAGAVGFNFFRELQASGLFKSVEFLPAGADVPAEPGTLVRGTLHQLDLDLHNGKSNVDITLEAVSLPEQKALFEVRRQFAETVGLKGGIGGAVGEGGFDDQVHQGVRKAFGALAKELAEKLAAQERAP